MTQRRITVGNRNQKPIYLVTTDDVVVMASSEAWRWAIGAHTDYLLSYLTRKRIPYHSFGYRPRKSDDFLVKSGAHVTASTRLLRS